MDDASLFVRATLRAWSEAAREATAALGRAPWLVLVPIVLTLLVGVLGALVRPLGIVGQFAGWIATAALLSFFLTLLEAAVAKDRVGLDDLGPAFGRHLGNIVGILFLFGIVDALLGFITNQNPAMAWLSIAVQAGIFVLANPVPELVYQGRREGLALIDDAVQFVRDNAPEWLLPLAACLLPFFLFGIRHGLGVMAGLGSANALLLVAGIVERVMPALDVAPVIATILAGALLSWIMLFRGFLFRLLDSSGRRQRIFEARMRS